MADQPQSKVTFKESDIVRLLPRHATMAAQMMASSAKIDIDVGVILVALLGGNAPPALAMYESIRASRVKTEMVQAAANSALGNGEQSQMLKDIFSIVDKALKPRNELAHWIWMARLDDKDHLYLYSPNGTPERI